MSELGNVLLHLRGLVLVRAILEQRGASAAELEEHTAEIERVRDELAKVASSAAEQAA